MPTQVSLFAWLPDIPLKAYYYNQSPCKDTQAAYSAGSCKQYWFLVNIYQVKSWLELPSRQLYTPLFFISAVFIDNKQSVTCIN